MARFSIGIKQFADIADILSNDREIHKISDDHGKDIYCDTKDQGRSKREPQSPGYPVYECEEDVIPRPVEISSDFLDLIYQLLIFVEQIMSLPARKKDIFPVQALICRSRSPSILVLL